MQDDSSTLEHFIEVGRILHVYSVGQYSNSILLDLSVCCTGTEDKYRRPGHGQALLNMTTAKCYDATVLTYDVT